MIIGKQSFFAIFGIQIAHRGTTGWRFVKVNDFTVR
jgi:hypothetical protein